jgi:hypothetical protein
MSTLLYIWCWTSTQIPCCDESGLMREGVCALTYYLTRVITIIATASNNWVTHHRKRLKSPRLDREWRPNTGPLSRRTLITPILKRIRFHSSCGLQDSLMQASHSKKNQRLLWELTLSFSEGRSRRAPLESMRKYTSMAATEWEEFLWIWPRDLRAGNKSLYRCRSALSRLTTTLPQLDAMIQILSERFLGFKARLKLMRMNQASQRITSSISP